jgi:methionine-rich copper-binding protein CopC
MRRALFGVLMSALPATAMAHAVLLDSVPAPNGHVAPGKLAIMFRYNSKIDTSRSKLTLTAPDGSETRLEVADGPAPALLAAKADVAPGAYTLRWQVLATDGHITRGSVPFTVDSPAPHSAAAK